MKPTTTLMHINFKKQRENTYMRMMERKTKNSHNVVTCRPQKAHTVE